MNKISIVTFFILVFSVNGAHAGSQLSQICSPGYHTNLTVQGINVSTEARGTYGMNVKLDGEWYFMAFQHGVDKIMPRDSMFELVKLAYISGEKVNACYGGDGYISGIELARN